MAIWKITPNLEQIAVMHRNTAAERLGIEFTAVGDDWIAARMPVDGRTMQPFGRLHGGSSVLLAETVGSIAANYCIDPAKHHCVGLEINANHVRAATSGWVTGTARPVHIGRSTHIWEIRIEDEAGRLTCISRLTMAVLSV